MALTGELSDLSLAELIEFFCNQRKTGRLKVIYPIGAGYFYLQAGTVVHARVGALRGIEAVYFALTLPNASFTFNPAFEPPEHTINQPWTSVVLEGLRRMDEGIRPGNPFPDEDHSRVEAPKPVAPGLKAATVRVNVAGIADSIPAHLDESEKTPAKVPADELVEVGAFLSQTEAAARFANGPWRLGAVLAAVALIVAVI